MRILLLGSEGFIGAALSNYLGVEHTVTRLKREKETERLALSQEYEFVINCASSKPQSSLEVASNSNFVYPLKIIETVKTQHWIQIESYFQLQIPLGRNDPYTLEKQRFSEYLCRRASSSEEPKIYRLFLPHIFGEGDGDLRLIRSAILAFKNGQTFNATSGSQYLPLLYISDALSGIAAFIKGPTSVAACTPFLYMTVKEIINLIGSQFSESKVNYGRISDPVDAKFPPVNFPLPVKNWKPKMDIRRFLDWVKAESD